MTKWELAELMGAKIYFNFDDPDKTRVDLQFGNNVWSWVTYGPVEQEQEYAADKIFERIQSAIYVGRDE